MNSLDSMTEAKVYISCVGLIGPPDIPCIHHPHLGPLVISSSGSIKVEQKDKNFCKAIWEST